MRAILLPLTVTIVTVAACARHPAPPSAVPPHAAVSSAAAGPEHAVEPAPAPSPSPVPAAPDSLAAKLDAAKAVHGGLLIAADQKGIHAFAPDLTPIADLSPARAKHLRVVAAGENRLLFFVVAAKHQIVRLDLHSGEQKVLATVPLVKNECFHSLVVDAAAPKGPEPGLNPFDYVQADRDFGVDPVAGIACFDIYDRNFNMASIAINFRVDLRRGKTAERVTVGGEACQTQVKGRPTTEPLCAVPHPQPDVVVTGQPWPLKPESQGLTPDSTSASGRFAVTLDPDVVAEQGDYVYSAPFVFDAQTGVVWTVAGRKLVPVSLKKLRKSKQLPRDTLTLVGESDVFWLAGADALVLGNGGSANASMTIPTSLYYVIRPPAAVHVLMASAATAY